MSKLNKPISSRTILFALSFLAIVTGHSQTFSPELQKIPAITGIDPSSPHYFDTDGDGDLDIIYSHNTFQFLLKNIGTPSSPSYDKPFPEPFGLTGLLCATFADIDGDGDLDAFGCKLVKKSEGYFNSVWCKNTGAIGSPQYTKMVDFGLGLNKILTEYRFVDIDGDGDLDVFGIYTPDLKTDSKLVFQENIGTAEEPSFSEISFDVFELPSLTTAIIEFADIDNDGDLDAYCFGKLNNEKEAKQYILMNDGDKKNPSFPEIICSTSIGLDKSLEYVKFVDIDGDGDKDAVGTINLELYYQENLTIE